MPPRVMQANEAGLGVNNWFQSLPPIMRSYGAAILVTSLGFRFGFVNLTYFALMWPKVFQKLEIWRLVTQFFFIGKLSISWLIRLTWIIQYAVPLEQQTYQFEPADFAFMLIIVASLLSAFTLVVKAYFNGVALIMAMVYLWSRNFPDQQVSIMGMVKIKSFYLPFAFCAMSLIMGDDITPDIAGIVAGHIYYFLWDLYPRAGGPNLLKTPVWLKNALADGLGIGAANAGVANNGIRVGQAAGAGAGGAPAPQQGFNAFRGGGRRLGTD
eukprot:gene17863-24253_t